MNVFSLDTNLILALINDKDRLNSISINIIETEKKKCALCKSVIKEARKIAREKISRAVANSFEAIVKIRDIEDPIKRDTELLKRFNTLMGKDPQLKNFYRLLYNKITVYIKKVGIKTLPRYLSNLSEHIARTLEPQLMNIVDYSHLVIDYSNSSMVKLLTDVKTATASVRFKDPMDYEIFCELATNISKNFNADFYTDDGEFSKKGKKAYALLEKNLSYDKSWLKIIHTDELT